MLSACVGVGVKGELTTESTAGGVVYTEAGFAFLKVGVEVGSLQTNLDGVDAGAMQADVNNMGGKHGYEYITPYIGLFIPTSDYAESMLYLNYGIPMLLGDSADSSSRSMELGWMFSVYDKSDIFAYLSLGYKWQHIDGMDLGSTKEDFNTEMLVLGFGIYFVSPPMHI
jgi:hypothetical protein